MEKKELINISENNVVKLNNDEKKDSFSHFKNPFFISFSYQSVEMKFDGKNTSMKGRNVSYNNGEYKDELFQGVMPGNSFLNQVLKAQLNFMKNLFNPFNLLAFRDKDKR